MYIKSQILISGSPYRSSVSHEQKSSESTFNSTHSSSFGTPPPSFVPTTISTEEASGIFERDVQDVSGSLEDLTTALTDSNRNSLVNKGTLCYSSSNNFLFSSLENVFLVPEMSESQVVQTNPEVVRKNSTDRDKKLEELLKKWNTTAPRSNRSTPHSSNHNSQESLDNLDFNKTSPRPLGSELDRLVPAPPVPRQRSKNLHERGSAEYDAVAPMKPPREPLTAANEDRAQFVFQVPAPIPRTSNERPIPKPRLKHSNEYEEKIEYL